MIIKLLHNILDFSNGVDCFEKILDFLEKNVEIGNV